MLKKHITQIITIIYYKVLNKIVQNVLCQAAIVEWSKCHCTVNYSDFSYMHPKITNAHYIFCPCIGLLTSAKWEPTKESWIRDKGHTMTFCYAKE